MKKIDVFLTTDVPNVGQRGDIKRVSGGFAKNALFPKKVARPAGKADYEEAQRRAARHAESERKKLASLKRLAERLSLAHITLRRSANEDGGLFGSVRAGDIVHVLHEHGFPELQNDAVVLAEPITKTGDIQIVCNLHSTLSVTVNCSVQARDANT